MQMQQPASRTRSDLGLRHRYKEVREPLYFPHRETVMESDVHRRLKTALWLILEQELGEEATVGSDHFVYWNARNPTRSLAPDVFVHCGPQQRGYLSWKTWELGTPQVAVEITSPSDRPEGPWQDKLERYHELGVQELVRYRRDQPGGQRLHIWDRVDQNLLEREVEGDVGVSNVLGLYWVGVEDPKWGPMLRVARDAEAEALLPTPVEHEARAREAAELRVRELEAELRRRGG